VLHVVAYYVGILIFNETSKGSVIVQFQLYIIAQVPDPLLPLKTLVKDNGGKINGLVIDYKSVLGKIININRVQQIVLEMFILYIYLYILYYIVVFYFL
jgi:hypothetical protein